MGGPQRLEMFGEVGFEDVDPLVGEEDDVIVVGPKLGVEVGSPRTGQEHPLLEHHPVDAAAPLKLLVLVVLGGVRHGSEDNGDSPLPRPLDRLLQVPDDVVLLHGASRHVPIRAALGQEIVHRVDHEQRRVLGHEPPRTLALRPVRPSATTVNADRAHRPSRGRSQRVPTQRRQRAFRSLTGE